MAHELYKVGDKHSMVRAANTDVSWHGLEHTLPETATFDDWVSHPVFDWKIQRSKVRYATAREDEDLADFATMDDRLVLFRSDTKAPLSVVSADYHVVQPKQVLEFFRDLCEANHLTMDTAGVIRGGLKFWALARTGQQFAVGGKDVVKQYVLLATSADSSMATVAKHTSVRTVCSNTFHASVNNNEAAVKIRHSKEFSETQVKLDLGLLDKEFSDLHTYAEAMHQAKVEVNAAKRWYAELLTGKADLLDDEVAEFADKSRLFSGFWRGYNHGPGAEDTAWGLLNGVTYTVDWVRGRSVDTRMDSAWFGAGASLKKAAWEKALDVIGAAKAGTEVVSA